MLLAMKDEARSHLNNEENDFLLDTSYADGNAETVPSYDAKAVSEVNASSKVHEQIRHEKRKTIIQTSDDDQIDSNIIFAGLGYKNPERLKKAIAALPKMYNGEKLHSLNALYETFVPQQDFTMEQTYFSIPSTSTNGSESKAVTSDLPIPKFPKESKLLKMFDTLGVAINGLRTRIDITLLEDRQQRWMSDSQNSLREFYKTDKNELLKDELAKSSSDSKDIQANLLKRIKIIKNDFKRSQAQSIDFELKLQHQKEKTACDVSWKSKLSTLNDEKVLLKTQVATVVKERETNQDLLITISELKNKLKTVDNGKNMNTKCDKSEASKTLLCVTPLPKNIAIKAKKVSNSKVNADRSKPVTSHPTPTNEQGVESSNSVRRQNSKDTKSKNRVLKNTNAKSSTAHVGKMSRSVSIDSNKCETMNLTLCHANKSVLNTKNVTAVNDGLNIVCVSCGKDVFLLSHEKCVARYALSRNSNVKRALFATPVFSASSLSHDSSQSKTLSNYMKNKIATSLKWQIWFEYQQSFNWSPKSKTAQSLLSETKSRIRVRSTSNTPVTTQKWVAKLSTLPSAFFLCDAGDSARPMDFRFENDHFAAITGYGDYVQGNLTICHVYYVEGLGHNLFSVEQFCDGDLEVAFLSNTRYVRNLEGDDLLTGSRDSNLYTISISDMAASSLVCLMSRATSKKSWLWHSRLSHLNFGTINQLKSKDLVDGASEI
ncbi:integrase, catalytic region, zinc finger, CCHC-type containing protein [Tanacetum coccineum]